MKYKAIKVTTENGTRYGISIKANAYLTWFGTFETRKEAQLVATLENVKHYDQLSRDMWGQSREACR